MFLVLIRNFHNLKKKLNYYCYFIFLDHLLHFNNSSFIYSFWQLFNNAFNWDDKVLKSHNNNLSIIFFSTQYDDEVTNFFLLNKLNFHNHNIFCIF